LLCLVIALLADDVSEGIKLLFCLINLLLQFGKGRLEVAHLVFLLVFLLLIQGS
jgi:ABC-type spermidine/putrescine transport system permease subunit II